MPSVVNDPVPLRAAPLAEEYAGRVELLDTAFPGRPRRRHRSVDGDAHRPTNCPAGRAPARELIAAAVELDDLVMTAIDHVDVARAVDRHAAGSQDPEADSGAAPLGRRRPAAPVVPAHKNEAPTMTRA